MARKKNISKDNLISWYMEFVLEHNHHPKSVFSNQDPYPSAKYPFNHVQESESGHIFEIDDTPDNERLYKEHMSGTFEEIHPQGTRVTKVVYDDYEIIARNKKIVIS